MLVSPTALDSLLLIQVDEGSQALINFNCSVFLKMTVSTGTSIDESIPDTYGVTEAMSLACATAEDIIETDKMLSYLDEVAPAESEEGWLHRWEVLIDLEDKVRDWLIGDCGVTVTSNHEVCKVLTFGSFRLGIIRPSSDIDTLVLIPSSVSRDRFFSEFITHILPLDPEVTECLPVTDARVPIAKVMFRGVYLDILVASVPADTIVPDMESVDDSLIFQVDEKCMKSMNGIRVADKILKLVPNPKTFREAARMIKFWAQARCIYSNSVGYFGGVSWSMAVARVCQLYPNFSAKQIVERFFYTYSSWPWDEHKPIVLCAPQEMKIPPSLIRQQGPSVFSQFKDWNPQKYSSDRFQVMPVITPIFPSHNTTYNCTDSQKRVIVDELKRGKEIIQLMQLSNGEMGWNILCSKCPFFSLFNSFLELNIWASDEVILTKFKGLVESRIRSLIKNIEQQNPEISTRPHPDFFFSESSRSMGSFFIGLSLYQTKSEQKISMKTAIDLFVSDTMEKSILAPEWAEINSNNIKLEIRVTDSPFPKEQEK